MALSHVVPVVGVTFDGRQRILKKLASMDKFPRVRLKREPDNEHDEWAIGVYVGKYSVGYIPREINEEVAILMGQDVVKKVSIEDVRLSDSDVYYMRIRLVMSTGGE